VTITPDFNLRAQNIPGDCTMKISCKWTDKLQFDATVGSHQVIMDARKPLGGDAGPTPKELLLASISGCTAMDVAALLRKGKQTPESFVVDAEADVSSDHHPHIYTQVRLAYRATGAVDPAILQDAVHRSMTQYCGVSAMIAKVCPITYVIELNGTQIAQGQAAFP
jgi:putative redox protein